MKTNPQRKSQTQIETEPNTEHPYTRRQWEALDEEGKGVIQSIADYLSGEKLPDHPSDQALSENLNLLRPCKGCVPAEEIDDSLAKSIRKKFVLVYWIAVELAVKELQRRGKNPGQDFNLSLVIDPDHEDFSYVTILDADRGHCLLHEGHKARHFHFATLIDLVDAVLTARNLLVSRVLDRLAKEKEIFVVMEGGVVHEIVDIPPGIHVTVIDHDTEGVDDDRLQKSPLNGQPCCLSHY